MADTSPDPPGTPSRSGDRTLPEPATPTPLRFAKWNDVLNRTFEDGEPPINRPMQRIVDICNRAAGDPDLVQGMLYQSYLVLRGIAARHGDPDDLFQAPLDDDDNTHANEPQPTRDQTREPSMFNDIDLDAEAAPGRSRATPSETTGVQVPAVQRAYLSLGWVNGTGHTENDPIISVPAIAVDPGLKAITHGLTQNTTVEDLELARDTFINRLGNQSFKARKQNRTVYMRLHPWMINQWANRLFVDAIGGSLRRVKAIIDGAVKTNTTGNTRSDMNIAREMSHDKSLHEVERAWWASYAVVVGQGFGDDAYNKFDVLVNEIALHSRLDAAVETLRTQPRSRFSVAVTNTVRPTRGQDYRTTVVSYFASKLGAGMGPLKSMLQRTMALMALVSVYGYAVVFCMTPEECNNLRHLNISAVTTVIKTFNDLVPEFMDYMDVLHTRVYSALRTGDNDTITTLHHRNLVTGKHCPTYGDDVKSRIEGTFDVSEQAVAEMDQATLDRAVDNIGYFDDTDEADNDDEDDEDEMDEE